VNKFFSFPITVAFIVTFARSYGEDVLRKECADLSQDFLKSNVGKTIVATGSINMITDVDPILCPTKPGSHTFVRLFGLSREKKFKNQSTEITAVIIYINPEKTIKKYYIQQTAAITMHSK